MNEASKLYRVMIEYKGELAGTGKIRNGSIDIETEVDKQNYYRYKDAQLIQGILNSVGVNAELVKTLAIV